ncbi:MAG: helix-turn-helix domain-containing protein, partial [Oscillospiraceae bacterium]|nr:helix-turn-helix domain-containing protein [Oscillospiraceae bacterium]
MLFIHNGLFDVEDPAPLSKKWRFDCAISDRLYLFYQFRDGRLHRRPVYHADFLFHQMQHLVREQIFLIENPTPQDLTTISDKLRWHRIRIGMFQKDVAAIMDVDRQTYSNFEMNVLKYYPLDKLKRAAELFGVDVTELLDEYNLFLYRGQGEQLRVLRARLGMTRIEFAAQLGIPVGTLKQWECD